MDGCMLLNYSRTTDRRATKLRTPTKHSPGNVSKLCLTAKLMGSAGFRNPIQGDRVAVATDQMRRQELDKG